MDKPRLLDLYSGAGGAARGYQLAGFDVTGVDIKPQPNYAGDRFILADALEYFYAHWNEYDAAHGSPPCPFYANVTKWKHGTWKVNNESHPDLIGPTRNAFTSTRLPWVIENVRTTELRHPFMLCGSMFGLRVRRHRYFESNCIPFHLMPTCRHSLLLPFMHKGERAYADALGCPWMTNKEGRQAVPPLYTKHIGAYLIQVVIEKVFMRSLNDSLRV